MSQQIRFILLLGAVLLGVLLMLALQAVILEKVTTKPTPSASVVIIEPTPSPTEEATASASPKLLFKSRVATPSPEVQ
jgi:hypothetical protein